MVFMVLFYSKDLQKEKLYSLIVVKGKHLYDIIKVTKKVNFNKFSLKCSCLYSQTIKHRDYLKDIFDLI